MKDALEKVKWAVELTADTPPTQANIIDTEAEILWKLKRYDEAIEAIDRAINIDPDSDYFREQREKFLKSMTQLQLKEARRLARACVKKNYKGC